MDAPITPMGRGMMGALSMASIILGLRRQQEQLELAKQREMQRYQIEQEELALRRQQLGEAERNNAWRRSREDFETEAKLRTSPAFEALAPGQTTRTVAFSLPADVHAQMPVPAAFPSSVRLEAPIENPLEFQGQKYAVRGREELFADDVRKLKTAEGIKTEGVVKQYRARRAADMERDAVQHGFQLQRIDVQEDRRDSRAEADRKSREKVAGSAEAGRNARAAQHEAGEDRRADTKKTSKPSQAEVQAKALEAEIGKLHKALIDDGELLKAGSAGSVPVSKKQAEDIHARIKGNKLKLQIREKQLKDIKGETPAAPAGKGTNPKDPIGVL